jgi:hypothetical protein
MDKDKEPRRKFEPSEQRRPRRLEEASTAEIRFPLVWIVIGGLAGLIVIGLVGLGVVNLVRQGAITPTPQVLPPLVEPVETPPSVESTSVAAESTTAATTTLSTAEQTSPSPEETVTTSEPSAPTSPQVDGYVKVVGTEGLGLSMRAGPGRNNARLGLVEERDDVILLVLAGPKEDENAEDYVWWFVRHSDGTEGWVVEDFIVPVEAP